MYGKTCTMANIVPNPLNSYIWKGFVIMHAICIIKRVYNQQIIDINDQKALIRLFKKFLEYKIILTQICDDELALKVKNYLHSQH